MNNKSISERKKVLILVPHQDDEINVAGNAIVKFLQEGINVYVVFSTNGDLKTDPNIRASEAYNAAKKLGISGSNLIFLGYGDNLRKETCLYKSFTNPIYSGYGRYKTYGNLHTNEYRYIKSGYHSKYTYNNFMKDLIDVILDIRADLIICNDFDVHIDHRMLTLSFDDAINYIIKHKEYKYKPEVWKRFAYSMAYFSEPDYFNRVNLLQNCRPRNELLKENEFNMIGNSLYQWENRIRIPAVQINKIYTNPLVQALDSYKSQYALFRFDRIINSDEVFWKKRTDNLVYDGKLTVSSGNAEYLYDFKFYDTDNIESINCNFNKSLWIPDDFDKQQIVSIDWLEPVDVKKIVIYGSILGNGYKGNIEVYFKKNSVYKFTNVNIDCKPFEYTFENALSNINHCEIKFANQFNNCAGIAEIEIFNSDISESIYKHYFHILINDNFVEKCYYVKKNHNNILKIDIYTDFKSEKYKLYIKAKKSFMNKNLLILSEDDKRTVLYAEDSTTHAIYKQVEILQLTGLEYRILLINRYVGKIWILYKRIITYFYNYHKMIKQFGWKYTLKIIMKKIIKKVFGK